MELKDTIRFYRKQKNMTQEEMASALGISTPAVNKWENGISCPDISLLAPLARLLEISLDTLLSFERQLSNKDIENLAKEANHRLQHQSFDDAWKWMLQKVHMYPNCDSLMLQMAVLANAFCLTHEEIRTSEIESQIYNWFKHLLQSQDETVRFHSATSLYHRFLNDGQYNQAEEILQFFSTQNPLRKQYQAFLYEKTGKTEEALKLYEELLFQEYQLISTIFASMNAISITQNDLQKSKILTNKMVQLARIFEMGRYHEVACQLDLATADKDIAKAEELFKEMIECIDTISSFTSSPLYQHMTFKPQDTDFIQDLKQKLMQSYQQEFHHQISES